MALLNLTDEGKTGLARLMEASDDAFKKLNASLKEPAEEVSNRLYVDRVRRSLCVNSRDAQAVCAVLGSLELNNGQMVEDIIETLEHLGLIAPTSSGSFKQRLLSLHVPRAFAAFNKASELLVRNERNFISAIGATDLRPVFSDDLTTEPDAFVLLHQLQIRFKYGVREPLEDFFVAMDEPDIDDLIETLLRLKKKAATLKEQLRHMKMPYLVSNRS